MTDSELLKAWATRRDEGAFAELVRRHLGLVHASARRQVGANPMADDVAQTVFLVLSRKAGSLGDRVVLSGWLFRTTRFVAARALRAEQRRTQRESLAAMQPDIQEASGDADSWHELAPHLDAALAALSSADRDAVLLRYLKGESLRVVSQQLGLQEEAAKKRVQRAVEKMRVWLTGKGVVLTTAALMTLMGSLSGSAAPTGLAGKITAAVVTNSASASAIALVEGTLRDWGFATARSYVPWAVAALLIASTTIRLPNSKAPGPIHLDPVASLPGPAERRVEERVNSSNMAKLLLNVRSSVDRRPLSAQVSASGWGRLGRLGRELYRTDARGTVEIPVNVSGLRDMYVAVSAPGFVPKQIVWKGHEFLEPVQVYQCLLDPGMILEGRVQDEEGQPIPRARVLFSHPASMGQREYVTFTKGFNAVETDSEGRFRSDQMPALQGGGFVRAYAEHSDFVGASVTLGNPESLATNQIFTLRRGRWISGHVEDPDHAPIPNASVEEENVFSEKKATSGAEGRFRIGPFAEGSVTLRVSADGFQQSNARVVVGVETNEVLVSMALPDGSKSEWEAGMDQAQTVRLVGTAVDAETGEPIPRFQIRLNENRGTSQVFLGEGHEGRFDWPVEMVFHREFSLEIGADGFEPTASGTRPVQSGTQNFEFRMHRGGMAKGRVVDANGQAVADAFVGVNGIGFGFTIREGRAVGGNDAPHARTSQQGQFSVGLRPYSETLVAVHEIGFASVPISKAQDAVVILKPWGHVDGRVMSAGLPVPGQRILLLPWLSGNEMDPLPANLSDSTLSDSEGRFRFNWVPPGTVALARQFAPSAGKSGLVGLGPLQRVDVKPGETTEITLATSGPSVTGRFVLSRPVAGYDWRADLQTLEEDQGVASRPSPRPPWGPKEHTENQVAARRRHSARNFCAEIQADGSFRIEDVPAGSYTFRIRVTEPPRDSGAEPSVQGLELGALSMRVEIPPGDARGPSLDLGVILIPVK